MIRKINLFLNKGLFWGTAFSAFLFFIMVCLNVFTRYILKTPILASIELSRIFFVWACFLAAGITYYRRGHIVISFVVDRFTQKIRHIISIIIYCLCLLLITGLLFWSIDVDIKLWHSEFPILGISQVWLYMPLTVVALTMVPFTIEIILNEFTELNPERAE